MERNGLILMSNLEAFFDEIDGARLRRAKELSEVKRSFKYAASGDVYGVKSKAVVVLSYACWEGFYNECVKSYLGFLKSSGRRVRDKDWSLLVGALSSDFDRVRDRNHSLEARHGFVAKLKNQIDCSYDSVDEKIVMARSNLDFSRLSENFGLLDFDLARMQRFRNRIDKELVGWRHSVAHGDSPDLTAMDVDAHVDFAAALLLEVADLFQEAMLTRV